MDPPLIHGHNDTVETRQARERHKTLARQVAVGGGDWKNTGKTLTLSTTTPQLWSIARVTFAASHDEQRCVRRMARLQGAGAMAMRGMTEAREEEVRAWAGDSFGRAWL